MDAHDLARWTRFAAKGGIGKCTAIVDCIAQEMGEDLMFLKDDQITVLMQLPESGFYLGHCEGVVGRFSGKDVRFHAKLKRPVIAKRGSLGLGASDSRMSISLLEGSPSRTDLSRPSESPSNSRPASRTKGTPSPRSHAPMQSYSTFSTRFSEDQSPSESRTTTVVGTSTVKDSRPSSTKSGHAKSAQMATSISGASILSVGSASVYSEASTATSVFSAADASERTRSRHSSIETEKDDIEYGNLVQASGSAFSMSDRMPSTPSGHAKLPASTSASTDMSSASTASTSGPATVSDSFGSVGSISELEAKQFDMSMFGVHAETDTSFVLVPPPLKMGEERNGLASPVVAPLRLTKSPRLTPSPGLPPSSPLPVPPAIGEHPRSMSVSPALPSPLARGSRPSTSASPSFPASLSPGLPGSLAPGPRSPGLPGALSPGVRSPGLSHGPNALTFSNPFVGQSHGSTPPASPYGPSAAPLSPPPSSPLPPLPSGSLPAPGTSAASAAASGRVSPLMVLPSTVRANRMGMGDEVEEGDTTRLSTLDAFRRQLEEGDDKSSEEHSDGEVGIGLSLMGALGGDDEDEEEQEEEKTGEARTNGAAMPWTRYTPSEPISPQSPDARQGEEAQPGGDEDEDDGGYWDDIYDDYRYSRYSLASKRFSAASKASGVSKASSKTRAQAPPIPVPPDRPSVDSRPSIGSDGYPRPSVESPSSMPFTRPSFARTTSEESTQDLPLTAQFPAVPVHVPVRTESRLRIVHEGYTEGDDHGEREQEVTHEGVNIEVIEAEEGDEHAQEVVGRRPDAHALSPLLHTTFGSPHSSRFTELDESDQDHSRKSPTSPGIASVLRAEMEATPTASEPPAPRPIVVPDPNPAMEAPSLLAPSTKTPNDPLQMQTMVAMDPVPTTTTSSSPFLRSRPPGGHPFSRTSLFLPHPNAPKTGHSSQGPMYGRPTAVSAVPPPHAPEEGGPPGTTRYATRILHEMQVRGARTVFGRCREDLGKSGGPVAMLFSLDPFPVVQSGGGVNKGTPTRAATVSAPVRREEELRLPKRVETTTLLVPIPTPTPIAREGFVAQVGAARPRSRSFSEFGAQGPVVVQEKSLEEPVVRPVRNGSLPPALMARHALSPLVVGAPSPGLGQPSPLTPLLNVDVALSSSPIVSSPVFTSSPDRDDVPLSGSTDGPPRLSTDSGDSGSMASPPPLPDTAPNARSSPLAHELPLRTKLSLPALRVKASVRSKLDDAVSVVSLPVSGENETVQVQDMDFELVKLTLPTVISRSSHESTREVESSKADGSPVLGDAASLYSSAPRSPLVASHAPPPPPPASTESAESIEGHRQRELRWMALFPTVPPSQARRNKKVRKLLQEGVPSSVRYLVWCHLTDSKARALPGVYAKLGQRTRVPAFAEIERDARAGLVDLPVQGQVVSVLQAYLSMVPDIQYSEGLTLIAGHLLSLAPEEDAFWIFASMMDAHLRTYFSTNAVQVEIDASLFSKALEVIDPALTKKLYVQLSIAPASITRPWFSTLFVESLSAELLHRVWDVFLYDGIPFLYRVGLVVINCVRHLLLQATTDEAALAYLARPPPACLPSASELLVLASNVKLKDDDVRKQRVKMEQQLKRTTQARPPNGVTNVQTATISLPKTSLSCP